MPEPFQQRKIVRKVIKALISLVAPLVRCYHLSAKPQLDVFGKCFQRYDLSDIAYRYRITVGLKLYQTVGAYSQFCSMGRVITAFR